MRKYTHWTIGEIEDLKYLRTVEKLSNKEIAEILGKNVRAVATCSYCYGIKIRKPWGQQDVELLKKFVFDTSFKKKEIARKLGRSEKAIAEKMAEVLGSFSLAKLRNENFLSRAGTKFTETEIKFLQNFYYVKGAKECASALKRTIISVRGKAKLLREQGVEFKKQIV